MNSRSSSLLALFALPLLVACGASADSASEPTSAEALGKSGDDPAPSDPASDSSDDATLAFDDGTPFVAPPRSTAAALPNTAAVETNAGAGKTVGCPANADLDVKATDDLEAKMQQSRAGDVICIRGNHRVKNAIAVKANQKLIGIGDARLNGSLALVGHWHKQGALWYYDGPEVLGPTAIHREPDTYLNPAGKIFFPLAQLEDDVFYDDRRMLRVGAVTELGSGTPPAGQVPTPAELGRFFYDAQARRIYIDRDPTNATVEVASTDTLVSGGGADASIENLTFEKSRKYGLVTGLSWKVDHVTARFVHDIGMHIDGGTAADHAAVTNTLITNNGRYGFSAHMADYLDITACEVSWNNIANYRDTSSKGTPGGYFAAGAAKITRSSVAVTIVDLDSHHNIGSGLWFDIHNVGVTVAGGSFHDNEAHGLFHEISCGIDIFGGTFSRNGFPIKTPAPAQPPPSGITSSDSVDENIHDNYVFGNAGGGISMVLAPHTGLLDKNSHGQPTVSCLGSRTDGDVSTVAKRNSIHDNLIDMCQGTTGFGNLGVDKTTLEARGNQFARNLYYVADATSTFWLDRSKEKFSAWQSSGLDVGVQKPQSKCTP